jgi:hypothetical protein
VAVQVCLSVCVCVCVFVHADDCEMSLPVLLSHSLSPPSPSRPLFQVQEIEERQGCVEMFGQMPEAAGAFLEAMAQVSRVGRYAYQGSH